MFYRIYNRWANYYFFLQDKYCGVNYALANYYRHISRCSLSAIRCCFRYLFCFWRVLLSVLLLACGNSDAAENGKYSYMPGSSSYFSAEIPPAPGLYYFNQLNYFHQKSLYDGDGNKRNVGLDVKGVINSFRFINVWDATPLGMSTFSSQLIIPTGYTDMSVSASQSKDYARGVGDIIFNPVYGKWQLTTWLHMVAGLDFVLPTGAYDKNNMINMGNNYWSIQPVMGVRYDNPSGLDIAINPRYSFNTRNDDTKYTSGDSLYLDFVFGWHLGPFEPAILGGLWKQMTADKQGGVDIGNRAQKLTIGPGISYRWKYFNFIAEYQHDYLAENTAGGDTFWINISMPLTGRLLCGQGK